MEKVNLNQQFANRLRDAMMKAGLNSQRSTSGVSINELAEITGYSLQICRRYLRGEAIPEPTKLVEIAAKLNVSAGWLLFGDSHNAYLNLEETITVNKKLLLYIFIKAGELYTQNLIKDAPGFLMELINDISQINANEEQSKKIIDLALSSAKHFCS
jgi:transcriptional regulator with XRE-family HTH domain